MYRPNNRIDYVFVVFFLVFGGGGDGYLVFIIDAGYPLHREHGQKKSLSGQTQGYLEILSKHRENTGNFV